MVNEVRGEVINCLSTAGEHNKNVSEKQKMSGDAEKEQVSFPRMRVCARMRARVHVFAIFPACVTFSNTKTIRRSELVPVDVTKDYTPFSEFPFLFRSGRAIIT